MIGEVLKKFEIYLHQLTANAIVRLSVYIWALRSQGRSANAKGFCRVHELHYKTKARADGLHKNFGCYNFAYGKDTKSFDMTRPLCNMQLGSPCQLAEVEFRVLAEHISTWDLVQEYLANKTFPTSGGSGMPKKKEGKNWARSIDVPIHVEGCL